MKEITFILLHVVLCRFLSSSTTDRPSSDNGGAIFIFLSAIVSFLMSRVRLISKCCFADSFYLHSQAVRFPLLCRRRVYKLVDSLPTSTVFSNGCFPPKVLNVRQQGVSRSWLVLDVSLVCSDSLFFSHPL